MPQPACQGEEVHGAGVPELGDREVERVVQCGEVGGDVVLAEQSARQRASVGEDLVGQLAAQHEVVGDALAGALLR